METAAPESVALQPLAPLAALQRRISHYMLGTPVISEPDALEIVRGALGDESVGTEELARFFADVADDLRPFHYGIQRAFTPGTGNDDTGLYFWVLYSTASDDLTRLSQYTPLELEFMRRIYDQIAASDTQCIREIDAMNLRIIRENQAVSYPAHDRESFIAVMLSEHWLERRPIGLAVGVRAVVELAAYLSEENRFGQCQMCHFPATFATSQCPNNSCRRRVHNHCLDRAVAGNLNLTCTSCEARYS